MKAAIFRENGGPEVVSVEEVEAPEPRAGEVRIRVEAAAMNHLDLWLRRGLPIDTPMPHIGGSDVVGVVESAGSEDDRRWIGKRVVVDPSLSYRWYELAGLPGTDVPPFGVFGEHTQGGFAELAVAPSENLMELPDHVASEVAAAASLAGVTAWRGLMTRGGLRPGESVLITGASGGVSSMAIQYAKLGGATVFALTSGADKVERVRDLGADYVYDRLEQDWSRELYRDTEKRGVHMCLDSVGEALWPQVVRALAVGGRIVSFGATTGPAGTFDIRMLFWRQLSILGSTMGTHREFREAMSQVIAGRVAPPIDSVLPLSEARRAHQLLEDGEVFGKLVLKPGEA